MFDAFLGACSARGIRPVALRELLAANGAPEADELALAPIEGREGAVGWQRSALAAARRADAGPSAARSS
jgi:hypothetical protein